MAICVYEKFPDNVFSLEICNLNSEQHKYVPSKLTGVSSTNPQSQVMKDFKLFKIASFVFALRNTGLCLTSLKNTQLTSLLLKYIYFFYNH